MNKNKNNSYKISSNIIRRFLIIVKVPIQYFFDFYENNLIFLNVIMDENLIESLYSTYLVSSINTASSTRAA